MIIAIEGLDGSGKHTQAEILAECLRQEKGINNVIILSYPKYGSPCCIAVEKFLKGDFGTDVERIDAYTASTFFAIDRYADYVEGWGKYYNPAMYVVVDRYVQSNMIHQMAKLHKEEWDKYIVWVEELEYKHNGLPKPDLTIYLDVPIEVSQKLMTQRYSGDENSKDIMERNLDYLAKCHCVAEYLSIRKNWKVINCTKNDEMLSREEIAEQIKFYVKKQEKISNFELKYRKQ